MSFNPKTEFEKLKLINPNLKEPSTLDKFDKKYFYIYFGPDIPLDIFMRNLGVSEDLAFVANKYGDKRMITKIIIKDNKDMSFEIIKHLFFNTSNKRIDKNDLIFLVSTEYFKGNSGILLRLIHERCSEINVSMIAFNYLQGAINDADILSILINCNGFCDFGFNDPKNTDIKRLYSGITNEKLKFIEFFCTKTNVNCVKGQIGYREMINSDMAPFHMAIWQCGLSMCDILNFYLDNNISSLPRPLNWISTLRIPLKFLCEIDCINLLARNPATLLSVTALPTFVKKVLDECNPAVCTVISSRSGIASVLSGTGLDYMLVPGRFLCETICCGSGSSSICNCCKTLRIRDLRNKFSIYKKMAICMTNFLCEMTNKAEFLNDVFALNELRQIIMFICGMFQDPNLRAILNEVSNIANAGIKVAMEELERVQTISFDRLFDLLIGGLHCLILRETSKKFFGSEGARMIGWVCDRFSEPARCMLKKVIRTVNVTTGRPSVPDVPGMIFECLNPCDILGQVSQLRFLRDMCNSCSGMARNFAVSIMKGQMPDLTSGIINCLGGCGIIRRALGGSPWINAVCDNCGGAVNGFARAALTGSLRMDDIISKAYQCLSPCNLINYVGDQMGPGGRSLGCMCDFGRCPCPINIEKCPCPLNPARCHIHWPHIHWPHAHWW